MLGPVTTRELDRLLAALPPRPRVVVSGNAATPWTLLRRVDAALETYVLHLLNPQAGVPDREGVTLETPFVGPGARRSPRLSYLPSRLSMVPLLYASRLPPDVVLLHTSLPHDGTVSMGTEVNVLPAAVEAARRRGGLVIAQVDPAMPYVYGDGVLPVVLAGPGRRGVRPAGLAGAAPRGRRVPRGGGERGPPDRGRRHPPDGHRQHPRRGAVGAR